MKHHQTIVDRHKATFEHYALVPADTVSQCDESTLISSFKRSKLTAGWVEITLTISPACLREQVRLGIEGRILEMENSPDTYGYVGTKGGRRQKGYRESFLEFDAQVVDALPQFSLPHPCRPR